MVYHVEMLVLVPFAFSFPSSFLRAANIISSLLRCRFACLSFLSCDQAFAFGESSAGGSPVAFNFDDRLYRVIRSGCDGFAGVVVREGGFDRDWGTTNVAGGCEKKSVYEHVLPAWFKTHRVQRPPTQRFLCRGGYVSSIPRQIPCYLPPIQLWEHLCDLVDLSGIDCDAAPLPWGGSRATR